MTKTVKNPFCSSSYNYTHVGELDGKEIVRLCLGLHEEVRAEALRVLTQDGKLISHGLCDLHHEEEMEETKKIIKLP